MNNKIFKLNIKKLNKKIKNQNKAQESGLGWPNMHGSIL